MAKLAAVTVAAPRAVIDYGKLGHGKVLLPRSMKRHYESGGLEVFHPLWLYPPFATPINAVCEFACTLPFALRRHLASRFDVIDAHFGYPEGIAAAMLAASLQIPFTVTLRGSEMLHAQRSVVRRRSMQAALRRAGRVIAVAEPLKEFALSLGVEESRVRTIPNGIDTSIFFLRDRAACRRRFGIPESTPVILSVGHLIELKGHHRIVESLARLRSEGIDAQLWIAGGHGRSADYEPTIRSTIERAGVGSQVRMVGSVSQQELAELMNAADVFCLASSREGWPNVVNEALACGTPAVATRVGGIPQMVIADEYGLIVPPGDQEALTAALRSALAKSWNREAIAAWGMSRSWGEVARETVAEFHALLKEKQPHTA